MALMMATNTAVTNYMNKLFLTAVVESIKTFATTLGTSITSGKSLK